MVDTPAPAAAPPVVDRLARASGAVSRACAYLAALAMGAPILLHVARGSRAYLAIFDDDFFYYAIIADRLVAHGTLTFDGITHTNGFHPLWFLVVLAARVATGGLGAPFFAVIGVVMLASMFVCYELFRVLARAIGAPAAVAAPIAAWLVVPTCKLLGSGMEVTIAIPLFTWLLIEVARGSDVTRRRAAKLGLIASLVVLARLDLGIAVALLLGGWAVLRRPRPADAIQTLAAFGAGGAALVAYLLFNRVAFGALLPTSAMAKQLATSDGVNVPFLRLALLENLYGLRFIVALPFGIAALVALVRRDPRDRPAARLAAGIALLFPLVFFAINALASDWCFFSWYGYPIGPALVASLALVAEWAAPYAHSVWRVRALAAVGAVLLAGALVSAGRWLVFYGLRTTMEDNSLTTMAIELTARMKDRPGVVAMGDKAGIAAYLLDRPVIQLEGLVCDRALLERIRAQRPLGEALRAYGVDYLVVSLGATRLEKRDGCYIVEHPNVDQSGPRSAKMRAAICEEPIEHFETPHGPNPWSRFLGLETFVFDVRGDRMDAVRPARP